MWFTGRPPAKPSALNWCAYQPNRSPLNQRLQPGLRRHQDQDAEQGRRDQPGEAGLQHRTGIELSAHQLQRTARDQEQEGQPPWASDQYALAQPALSVAAVHMPVEGGVDEGDVEQDEQAEGPDA
jgi:hypothetical protein